MVNGYGMYKVYMLDDFGDRYWLLPGNARYANIQQAEKAIEDYNMNIEKSKQKLVKYIYK